MVFCVGAGGKLRRPKRVLCVCVWQYCVFSASDTGASIEPIGPKKLLNPTIFSRADIIISASVRLETFEVF